MIQLYSLLYLALGKTKLLRWLALGAAKKGEVVMHIQAEGTKQECMSGYYAMIMKKNYRDVERGSFTEDDKKFCLNSIENISGSLFVHAFEQFHTVSLDDIYDYLLDFKRLKGITPTTLIIDYFELIDPYRGERFRLTHERERRIKLSECLKNLALEFKLGIITATQATTVPAGLLNDKNFVLTREHIAESKNIINPFSHCFTLNQTLHEYRSNEMRIYAEKIRYHSAKQVLSIKQNYDKEQFYTE